MGSSIYFLFLVTLYHHPHFAHAHIFGDSIMDTGNAVTLYSNLPADKPPYGKTHMDTPTGRWSDGSLISDLIYPNMILYTTWNDDDTDRVNFAYAGSTALNTSALLSYGIKASNIPSLGEQLAYFVQTLMPCFSVYGCRDYFYTGGASIYFGPFGGTDIIYATVQGKSFDEIASLIPAIAEAIIRGITEIISVGDTDTINVNLNFPLGCFPFARNYFRCQNNISYDEYNCVKDLNNVAKYLNNLVITGVEGIQNSTPSVKLTTFDYYTAFLDLIQNATSNATSNVFDPTTVFQPCCGDGIFNLSSQFCSGLDAPVCNNPENYIHWDGIHLTQAAYQAIYNVVYPH